MNIRLILDASALRAYVANDTRAVDLAELLKNVEENRDACGIPALCLLAAVKDVAATDKRRLMRFADGTDSPTVVLPLGAPDIPALAQLAAHMPDAHAHAAAERAKHGAVLGTYERSRYARTMDEDDILDL
jgi:hypothetical protein